MNHFRAVFVRATLIVFDWSDLKLFHCVICSLHKRVNVCPSWFDFANQRSLAGGSGNTTVSCTMVAPAGVLFFWHIERPFLFVSEKEAGKFTVRLKEAVTMVSLFQVSDKPTDLEEMEKWLEENTGVSTHFLSLLSSLRHH